MVAKCLNLGCGNDYRESTEAREWVNLDVGDCRKDVEADIESPLPFKDSSFDLILAVHVLEHIERNNFANVIRELYRISADKAIWEIAVPHAFSDNFITDPTHKMPFSIRTFDFFMDGTQLRENGLIYGWGDIQLVHVKLPWLDGNQTIHFLVQVVK